MLDENMVSSKKPSEALVERLSTSVIDRLSSVMAGLNLGLIQEFEAMEADMKSAASRIALLERKVAFLSAATQKPVDIVDQARDALQTCIDSMEADCRAHHRMALNTADQAFQQLLRAETLPPSPEAAGLLLLAEQQKWSITPQTNGGWIIETADCFGDDGQEREIVRTRGSLTAALLEAVEDELPKEFEWLLMASRNRQIAYVPDGWQIVPQKLTSDMKEAAYAAADAFEKSDTGAWCGLTSTYAAMIENAPVPPSKLFPPFANQKEVEKSGWDAKTYFAELSDYAWDTYRSVVVDLDTVKPKVGQFQAEHRGHLRKIYAEARKNFPEFADTLLWILRYKGIEANRHSTLAESAGFGRQVLKDDEITWKYWHGKARRSDRNRRTLIAALKALIAGAKPCGDNDDGENTVVVKADDITRAEYVLQDAGELARNMEVVS